MKNKIIILNDRELQLIQHSLDSFANAFFPAADLQEEIRALERKIKLIRTEK